MGLGVAMATEASAAEPAVPSLVDRYFTRWYKTGKCVGGGTLVVRCGLPLWQCRDPEEEPRTLPRLTRSGPRRSCVDRGGGIGRPGTLVEMRGLQRGRPAGMLKQAELLAVHVGGPGAPS